MPSRHPQGIDLRYTYTKRELPTANPLANALVVIAGALIIGVSIVLGFFAFLALSALVLVSAAVIGVRVWWLKRKLGDQPAANRSGPQGKAPAGVIEGEFHVVDKDHDQS